MVKAVKCQTPSIPRKGTETETFPPLEDKFKLGQTPSIPRKGTETWAPRDVVTWNKASDTLNSPQGDGNSTSKTPRCIAPTVRHPQFPARGRKHNARYRSCQGKTWVRHPQFPARGRKPKQGAFSAGLIQWSDTLNSPQGDGNSVVVALPVSHGLISVRHPQFPARGRKRGREVCGCPESGLVRHPQFPARGRKLWDKPAHPPYSLVSDTLNSPQGDGNSKIFFIPAGISLGQTPSIPRKGTETRLWRISLHNCFSVRHPQFPARGRKPKRRLRKRRSPSRVRHPQFPARGRKLED